MQIRLTVLGPRSGHQIAPATCDVLVTAPVGTPLAAVASGLAATVAGPDTGGTVVLYAGAERLDPQRRVLGEPPLVDGAVLALHTPVAEVAPGPDEGLGAPQLHVVAGPDAGGVHLLHPGSLRIGRSADADVPLDDPDVSRLHCAVTVTEDGRVSVADLDSTNGTALDGIPVAGAPVRLAPGALLRVGESTLRLAGPAAPTLALTPDLQGHLALPAPTAPDSGADPDGPGAAHPGHAPEHAPAHAPGPRPATAGAGPYPARDGGAGRTGGHPEPTGPGPAPHAAHSRSDTPAGGTRSGHPATAWPAAGGPGSDTGPGARAADGPPAGPRTRHPGGAPPGGGGAEAAHWGGPG
ncbi:FHA domain-containing protein, partial [Streptomyces sp. NPDC059917]|uniref:FHA domain-containing protein n=1 Tax=Streptomyces sp. NPDC059917 TaxID=3347002 RepID=UPI003659DD5D